MAMKNKRIWSVLTIAARVLPFAVILALIVVYGPRLRGMTVADILSYTPPDPPLAAAVLVDFYALKSVSVVFPLLVLYVAAGMLFHPLTAVGINALGLLVCVTIPYGIGRLAGSEFVGRLLVKHPKAAQLHDLTMGRSPVLTALFLRVINLLPGDLVSLFLGAARMPYLRYLVGSMIGLFPTMIAATLVGATITDPASPAFSLSVGATVALSAASFLLYRRRIKRLRAASAASGDSDTVKPGTEQPDP